MSDKVTTPDALLSGVMSELSMNDKVTAPDALLSGGMSELSMNDKVTATSLDLVPIAAFYSRRKHTGVYIAFLLACYNDKDEEYQSICTIRNGFSEVELEKCTARLRSKVIPKPKPYYRCSNVNPDVWFEPTEVWEVKAADLSISPSFHAAIGIVDPNKGISLRFSRLVRVREGKSPEQAKTSEQVAEMYRDHRQLRRIFARTNQPDE